ncbi:16S rRNA (guanine(527)-N(7))-methyltransferase RsmG [Sphingomonas lutea]|uniref:Ribosomal RNA small subunit methyltransferase G n=1 Tax=Sphingomonas lutea TaxID=1045317 RepID=A0A7G9SIH4_9SPHN|nr:16S rRNA (guanine(527)-N(7))-methyltransferase RsmG [Sphingomonas lutea]QNN67649.1 16S rRNA (guanine(527)-N(7))-methyltransferase RsmG [Sphingomonas lutea]
MIEALARAAGRPVSRETYERLAEYAELLRQENQRQNLVSRGTLEAIWERHVLDSAQIVRFEPAAGASWVDIGSGAGLPGIVIACLVEGPVTLVEPRRLRADFLARVSEALSLNVRVTATKAERAQGKFDIITGRAVAGLSAFLSLSAHLSTRNTVWALPKGRKAHSELAEARRAWQGRFHVEQSVTDADSWIVIGTEVRPRQS